MKKEVIFIKLFETIKQAERFQNKLYEKYNKVEIIKLPSFSNSGIYSWKVK